MNKQHTAVFQKIVVINIEGKHVGNGYLILYDNGRMANSELTDDEGMLLPPGEYALLRTGEEKLVVLTKGIQ